MNKCAFTNRENASPLPLAMRAFGAPSRYVQGPGVLSQIGAFAAHGGARALLIADEMVFQLVGEHARAACDSAGVELRYLRFNGEVTWAEINRLAAAAREIGPNVVLATGGGKGIDVGKAVSRELRIPVISIPTAASNDAPTSKIFVVYDEHHRLQSVEHMAFNPMAVIVDTAVVAQAPARMLLAGIGDALSKKFEVERCAAAGGLNLFGGRGTRTAGAMADMCYTMLRQSAVEAMGAVSRGAPNAALEDCVEAAVLLSGMCFENGGLSIAHALTRGLTAARGARDALHGLQVAYGLLVQLKLEQRDDTFASDLVAFYESIGLPRSLADLGMPNASSEEIAAISSLCMSAPHVSNFPSVLSAAEIAIAIERVEEESRSH